MFEHFIKTHQKTCRRCSKKFLPQTTKTKYCGNCAGLYDSELTTRRKISIKRMCNLRAQGETYKEIAKALKCSEGYVSKKIREVRRGLGY